jgi:RHS repeat-associated protein
VSKPTHQVGKRRPGRGRQRLPGVAQVVKSEPLHAGLRPCSSEGLVEGVAAHRAAVRGTTVYNESFTYDGKGRLSRYCKNTTTCSAMSSANVSYSYDADNQLTQQVRTGFSNPGTYAYSYDDAGEMYQLVKTPTTGSPTTTTYSYDADGQLTTAGRQWDVLGEMTASSVGGTSATYAYDGEGNRSGVTTSAGTTSLSWDVNNRMPMLAVVTDTNGHVSSNRYTPAGLLWETNHPSETYTRSFFGHDANGSITDAYKGTGTAAWNFGYEPFGATRETNQLVTPAVTPKFGFTGGYIEPALGGDYAFRARDYDPVLDQFNAPDPAKPDLQQIYYGPYVYAVQNPLMNSDPTGRNNYYCETCGAEGGGEVPQGGDGGDGGEAGDAGDTGDAGDAASSTPQPVPPESSTTDTSLGRHLCEDASEEGSDVSDPRPDPEGGARVLVIGRTSDLVEPGALGANEYTLLDKLSPDLGSPRANWYRNASVLRGELRTGITQIRDASPGDFGGAFLNAERNLLENHGWLFDRATGMWTAPRVGSQ